MFGSVLYVFVMFNRIFAYLGDKFWWFEYKFAYENVFSERLSVSRFMVVIGWFINVVEFMVSVGFMKVIVCIVLCIFVIFMSLSMRRFVVGSATDVIVMFVSGGSRVNSDVFVSVILSLLVKYVGS